MPRKKTYKSKDFAVAAAKIAQELHSTEVVVLDLRKTSPVTEYYVFATGTSARQMRTVCDKISEAGRGMGFEKFGRAGYEQAKWILLDFVSVVVHIFDADFRRFYDLEMLWGDCPRVDIEAKPKTRKKKTT